MRQLAFASDMRLHDEISFVHYDHLLVCCFFLCLLLLAMCLRLCLAVRESVVPILYDRLALLLALALSDKLRSDTLSLLLGDLSSTLCASTPS